MREIEVIKDVAPNGEVEDILKVNQSGVGIKLTALPFPPSQPMTFSVWARAAEQTTITLDALG